MTDAGPIFELIAGDGPLVAAAIHDGHAVRAEVGERLALSEAQRLREEDPFTAAWAAIAPSRIIGRRSRFEVDLNRPREGAVYRTPEQAWGLRVWKDGLPDGVVERSLAEYDRFYAAVRGLLDGVAQRHGRFVVFDFHSYNHRRDGAEAPPADPRENPDINVGTGTMPRRRWAPVVDRFIADLRAAAPALDVRENVRFRGGHFSDWVHAAYPGVGCCLAIEVKKVFMDELMGTPDPQRIDAIGRALAATTPGVREGLARGEAGHG